MTERLLKVLPLGVFGSLIAVLTAGFTPAQEPIPLRPPVPAGADPEPLPLPLPGKPIQPVEGEGAGSAREGAGSRGVRHHRGSPGRDAGRREATARADRGTAAGPEARGRQRAVDPRLLALGRGGRASSSGSAGSGASRRRAACGCPGSWREVQGGWQWVQRLLAGSAAAAGAATAGSAGDRVPAAAAGEHRGRPERRRRRARRTSTCPGRGCGAGSYVWRPGVWIEHRPNWVWVPAHYHWTPAGLRVL